MLRKLGFLLLFILFVSVNFYIYIRGSQAIPANIAIHALYTILFLVCVLSFFIAILFEGKLPGFIISIFESIGGYWMITILYFLVAVLLADFIRLTATLFNIFPNTIKSNSAQIKGIYGGFVLLVGIVFSIIGYIRFLHPQTVILNLDINKNIDQPEQLSIVAVSDLHLGNIIRKRHLVKYVEMINRKQPDLILIAGDLIDRNLVSVEAQQLDQVLLKLKATYGVYAVVGNHDYFRNIEKTIQFMVKSNINVLRDRAVIIDHKFVIMGRDDVTNKNRKSIQSIISNINKELPMILLDHQPVILSEAVENKIDVQISGHTHNGQIFPYNLLVAKMYELGYGYRKIGSTHFYVSSGLGLWGAPIRLGTQSEIVEIHLNISPKVQA